MNSQEFTTTVRKYFDRFAEERGFNFFKPTISIVLGHVIYGNDSCTMKFLYGAPEWRVELELTNKKTKGRVGLGDLSKVPLIFDWMKKNVSTADVPSGVDIDLAWYRRLLEETPALKFVDEKK